MSSRCPERRVSRTASAFALIAALLSGVDALADAEALRVCADPDNLPFSHADGTGFENRIARLVADDLQMPLAYEWLPQIRGYVRKTMGAGLCDVFIGVPAGFERVLTTKPYYRSTYVFVSRRDPDRPPLASFDDARLSALAIGVQLPGDDLAATPPGHALALKGAIDNVTGFPLIGAPPSAARIVAAIDAGTLDAGVLWGPQAAFFARRSKTPLALVPARAPRELAALPFEFGIAMGVRRGDKALRDRLDDVIVRRRADIDAILAAYAVPRSDRQP
jgi:mxaJ protein